MKIYQVVDRNDKPQYGVKGKNLLHSMENMYHRSSHIIIEVFGGKILLQKKAPNTENGGLWSSAVSGHVEVGETYKEAALREAKEELGIEIDESSMNRIGTFDPIYNPQTNKEFVTLFSYLLDPRKERITINKKELDGIAIMPRKYLEEDIKRYRDRYSPVFVLLFDLFISINGV